MSAPLVPERDGINGSRQPDYGTTANEDPPIELAEVVESFGLRRIHVFLLLVHAIASATAATVMMPAFLSLKAIRDAYGVSHSASTLASTGVSAGALFGVPLFGWLNDAIGRKTCMIMEAVLILVLGLTHILLPSGTSGSEFAAFVALRIAIGVPFGGLASLACVHLLEFVPAGRRGLMAMLGTLGWSCGGIAVIVIADKLVVEWRTLYCAPVPFCVILIVVLIFAYESPRWLYVSGNDARGRVVVEAVLRSLPVFSDATSSLTSAPARVVISQSQDEHEKSSLQDRLRTLFGWKLRYIMMCCILAMVAINGATYGVSVWMPEILRDLLGRDRLPYQLLVWGQVADICGIICSALTLDIIGRRYIMVGSCSIYAFCLSILPHGGTSLPYIAITYIFIQFMVSFMWGSAKLYCAEALPTDVRGTGQAISSGLGRCAGMILPAVVGVILEGKGVEGTDGAIGPVHLALYCMALVALGGAAAGILIPQETANAKLSDV
eukprot:gnl/TRDRNA2_/TRDRNA2_37947_c0_seq1.p1 gnl/TRDRNA2_/TRDRNA2_37947_c0~~gnl/TRDRNA2_/TRDRNA2_37947_c0_seq1.p1  ORF type:complete len:495 (+),score=54.15 gnl/TRDRNA2_/TRDRNA2_37947_c0_seq1:193-1677(+)